MRSKLLCLVASSVLTGCLSVVHSMPYKSYEGEARPLAEVARVIPLLLGQAGGSLNLRTVDGKDARDAGSGMPPSEVQLLPGKHTLGGGILFAGCSSALTIDIDAKRGAIYYLNFLQGQAGGPIFSVTEELEGKRTELSRQTLDKTCPTVTLSF